MDEARTVLPGVLHLQNHGTEAVQKYIDSICDRMDDENSPEHHIAVTFGADSFLWPSHSIDVATESGQHCRLQLAGNRVH